ncbi:MAG: ATP-binding cassette domain-containing protein [Clostridia bacterium]|nr:ATP-binding cassette domain-containing protein [Clostridia bacterium]
MIEIKNLTKSYGKSKALDDVSFTVNSGEILGFLGPNGAGKSTTMNIITGYISATSGTVTINGYDNIENSNECKKAVGYLPEQPPLYMDMTVDEYLDFVYDIKKASQPRKEHIDGILELVDITDVRGRLIKNLSKGYKQRVGIAQALIGDPEILILDEPTVGLDPKQILEIRNVIKELGKDRTIILSSHILPEISAICERVIIINKGKIVAVDTPENLSKKLTNDNKFVIRVAGNKHEIEDAVSSIAGIRYIESLGQKEEGSYDYIIESEKDVDVRSELFGVLASKNMPILMVKAVDMSLEDIFLQITDGDIILTDEEEAAEATESDEEIQEDVESAQELTEDSDTSETSEEIKEDEE